MVDQGDHDTRYGAFISYSRADRARAVRLQRRLEGYRLPRRLVRKGHPRRILPVFLDREELSAAPDLTEALQEALAASAHLIVLCSPAAAASAWVAREIEFFRGARPGGTVIAALFEGTSATAFPPPLREDGAGHTRQPLAADFRRGGDGRLALLKLLAPLAGVGLDRLVQRDAQRRLRRVMALAVAAVLAIALAAALVVSAVQQRAAAEQARARSEAAIGYQLGDLRPQLEAAGRLDLLDRLNRGIERYYVGRDLSALPGDELLQFAELRQNQASDDEQRGRLTAAAAHAADAWRITAALLSARAGDPRVRFAHAQSEYYRGLIAWRQRDVAAAGRWFAAYRASAQRLVSLEPRNPDWWMERGYADSNIGSLTLRERGRLAQARAAFQSSQAAFAEVARQRPGDAAARYEMADGEAWLADVDRLAGDLRGALAHREAQRRLLDTLVAAEPRDARYRTDLVANLLGRARIAAAAGRATAAIALFEEAHTGALALTSANPDSAAAARQQRAIELFRAQAWLELPARRRPVAAITAALNGCAARSRDNAELAVFCELLYARSLRQQGDSAGADKIIGSLRTRGLLSSETISERWRLILDAAVADNGRGR